MLRDLLGITNRAARAERTKDLEQQVQIKKDEQILSSIRVRDQSRTAVYGARQTVAAAQAAARLVEHARR